MTQFDDERERVNYLEGLCLVRDDVKIREDHLEKRAEIAAPECNNHAGVAAAHIY